MKKEKINGHFCNGIWRKSLIAYLPPAILLKKGEENEMADRLNVIRFSDLELKNMSMGTMAFRHMVYKNYCVNQCFSYL